MGAIYLVRHGQAGTMAIGGDYDRLSEVGVAQAQRAGLELARRGVEVAQVLSGTLERQRVTARVLATAAAAPVAPDVDPRWNEYDHRDILVRGGVSTLAASAHIGWPPRLSLQDGLEQGLREWIEHRKPGRYRESWEEFTARSVAALDECQHNSGATVVVTSAGVISAIVAHLWGVGADTWIAVQRVIANAGITTLTVGKRGISLISFNEHSHVLDPDGPHQGLLTYR